ncbi:hypothetical protein FS749_013629 [Ceratobasidium sp. UAMH 11750]|nr:hypothetical protein FS749_013629 [Ceratobasidium sp. UAMH 11750]
MPDSGPSHWVVVFNPGWVNQLCLCFTPVRDHRGKYPEFRASWLVNSLGTQVKYYGASPNRRKKLFKSHLDVYVSQLFISELLMSLGGILDGKWAHETQVYCGGYCDAQASLQFLGETSVSIWTLAITLHTGWSIVQARALDFRPWFCFAVVAAVWIYVFAFNFGAYASVSPINDDDPANYAAPTPFWCWIGQTHGAKRFGEYIWLWLAGVGNIVVYVPLFLLLRGNIVLGNDGDLLSARWHTTPQPPPRTSTVKSDSTSALSAEDESDVREDCWKMLYYPAAYTVLVLPLSVVRWMGFADPSFADPHLPTMTSLGTATMVFHALYRLSGVINVVLVLGTRPNVLLLGKRNKEDDAEENQALPANNERNASNPALRQRANAAQPMEQEGGEKRTGFGGPAINLSRGED